MRNLPNVPDDEVKGLAAFQDPDGLVVGQTVKGATVALDNFVAELKSQPEMTSLVVVAVWQN